MPNRARTDDDPVGQLKRNTTEYGESKKAERKMFASRLYRHMLAKGWNQAELSRQTKVHDPRDGQPGIGRDMIGGYIRGLHLPEPPYIRILAATFGVEPEALLPTVAEEAAQRVAALPPPALSFESTANGNAMLHVNLEMPQSLAIRVLAMIQEAGVEAP